MDDEPIGLHCPVCDAEPFMVFAGTQAFCDTETCPVFTWNPARSRAWFFANASEATVTRVFANASETTSARQEAGGTAPGVA